MKHPRADYQRIQDPSGKIPNDEPVMLFRAQDVFMPSLLKHYVLLLRSNAVALDDMGMDSKPLKQMAQVVENHLQEVQAWQIRNGAKVPDL